MPLDLWGPWRASDDDERASEGLKDVGKAVREMLAREVVLDMLKDFTTFAARSGRTIKMIARYQQYHAVNKIVQRVVLGQDAQGLDLAFSRLRQVAADGLRGAEAARQSAAEKSDRADRGGSHRPRHADHRNVHGDRSRNVVTTENRDELQQLLSAGVRKVIITTIHKFAEANGVLNDGSNIIVMVDEAHRTQEGDLGRQMREALPNAFLFGLTGTPINKRDRNTFYAFGADEDEHGYMDRYSFEASIRDQATLPLQVRSAAGRAARRSDGD